MQPCPHRVLITSVSRSYHVRVSFVLSVSCSCHIRIAFALSVSYPSVIRVMFGYIRVASVSRPSYIREHCPYHVRLWIWLKSRVLSATDNNLVVSLSDPCMCKRTINQLTLAGLVWHWCFCKPHWGPDAQTWLLCLYLSWSKTDCSIYHIDWVYTSFSIHRNCDLNSYLISSFTNEHVNNQTARHIVPLLFAVEVGDTILATTIVVWLVAFPVIESNGNPRRLPQKCAFICCISCSEPYGTA